MMEPFRMETDPDGTSQQVAVIMTGQVYREAGLKYSKHPQVEGLLYDKLCSIGKHKLRDDVRKLALSIALKVSDKEFQPTIAWLDDFMRRFCLSKKMMGTYSSSMLKQKVFTQSAVKPAVPKQSMSQKDVFDVLGINVDDGPSSNKDSASVDNEELENASENCAGKQSTEDANAVIDNTENEQNCEAKESTKDANAVMENGENKSSKETVVAENVNGVIDMDSSIEDINANNTENNVDDASDNKTHSEVDGACTENSNTKNKIDKPLDTSEQNPNAQTTNNSDHNDENEVVFLDDDSDDNEEPQHSGGKKEADCKIGKISIKKFEDLCETGSEKKEKKEKHSDSKDEKPDEEEMSTESSKEGEMTTDESSSTNEEDGSDSGSEKKVEAAPPPKECEINYTSAENKYYKKNIDALQKKLEGSVIKCTSCFEQVNHHIKSLVYTHPVLGLFMCKRCHKYYGRGRFCKDKEGYDEYCRLCAEGGELLCCEQKGCFNGFCKRCIKRNLGRAELKNAETTEGWACYVCDPKPLVELRALHRLIQDNLKSSEKENSSLSRKDLKTKDLQNKFKSLKQVRQMRSVKEASKTVNKEAEGGKTSKTDRNNDEKEDKTSKDNKQKISNKGSENKDEESKSKPCSILRKTMDDMLEMMSKCLDNIRIIESKWEKSKYSPTGTERARHHVLKQLEAMKVNFETLGSDLIESSAKEVEKQKEQEKEHDKEVSGEKVRKTRVTDKKQNDKSPVEQEENETCRKGNQVLKNPALQSNSDILNEGKGAGNKENEEQSDALESHTENEGMEIDPSNEFVDPLESCEVGSLHSSKDGLKSDTEDSLPDLTDVIMDVISDADDPMDTEAKSTVDIGSDIPKLLDDVGMKMDKEEKEMGDTIDAKCLGEEVGKATDIEAGKSVFPGRRRPRSSGDEAKSDSHASEDEKRSQRTTQRSKRLRCSRDSDNDSTTEKQTRTRRGEKVRDSNEATEMDEIDEVEKLDKSHSESRLKSDTEEKCESSFKKDKEKKVSRDSSEENEEAEDLNKAKKKKVQNNDNIDSSKSGEEKTEKQENEKIKTRERRNKKTDDNDESGMESDDGSGSTKETSLKRKRVSSKDITDQKKKGRDTQNSDVSKKGKKDQKKEESSTDDNSVKCKRTRRSMRRTGREDKDNTLGKASATSEEENTDEEAQSQRDDHTKKRRGIKKKEESSSDDNAVKSKKTRKSKRGMGSEEKDEALAEASVTSEKENTDEDIPKQQDDQTKKGRGRKKKEESSEDTAVKRKRRQSKRRRSESKEDDIFLGLTEDSATSEEENTDEEIQRRREDHTEKRRDRKKKEKKSESEEKEDSSEVKMMKAESSEDEKEEKESKKETDSQEEKKIKKKINETLSSKEDNTGKIKKEIKSEKKDGIKKREHDVEEESKQSPMSDEELSEKEEKKVSKKKKNPIKTANQKAKAALLESESDDEQEELPMPRSKKKHARRQLDLLKRRKCQRKIKFAISEEEQDKLKEKQLNSSCNVLVEYLSSKVKKNLEEQEFIYTSDYPELEYSVNKQRFDSDDCDADGEEDSDKEFSRLMKFKGGRINSKPGPKSKKKKLREEEESSAGDDDDGHEKDEERAGEAEDATKEENQEKTDKKESRKKERKQKEGLLDIDIDKDGEEDNEDDDDDVRKEKKEGGISLNEKMKKHILMSSEEEVEEEEDQGDTPNKEKYEEERERAKYDKRKEREAKKKKKENDEDSDEGAPKVHRKGYMSLNISTDEEKEDEIEEEEEEEEEEEAESSEEDSDFEESPRKRRAFQISSSDSDSGRKKAKSDVSSEEESEEEEEKPKSKRKRIRKMSSSSDEGGDDDEGEGNKDSPSKHKKLRRRIRDEDLMESTKNATQEEEERRKRIAERQKSYNQIFMIDVESDQTDLKKLVLDFDPETKAELVSVNEKLVKLLKPHQFKGIKFMWDASVESLEQLKAKPGGGCILAHSMGLGKTLQVITFCHTLLTNKSVSKEIQRIMVCCPVNTIFNWVAEFKSWLKGKMLSFDVIELASAKDLWGRAYRLDDWWKEGGICIIGYNMFRNLSNDKNKRYKGKMKEIFQKTLINPGPDVMVCDEGHMLKNEKTALSIAINKIKTMRRIVLTGTPLQNNLKEYHCMIQFVKPNLLGTKKEFMNRFVNPIEQGQCVEAMPKDVRRMKRRAHILHNLLEGCVQRFDYTVLKPFLPPKFEYVISVQLSEMQCKLYQYYLENLARGGPKRQGSGLFVDFGALSRVWTHPKVLELAVRRAMLNDDEEDLEDFICDDSTSEESSDDERAKRKKKRQKKKEEEVEEDEEEEEEDEEAEVQEESEETNKHGLTEDGRVRVDWWKKVLRDIAGEDFEESDYLDKIEHSGKLTLLLEILRECCSIGDKLLLFSQSLLSLDMIEEFLQAIDQGEIELPVSDDSLPLPYKHWKRDRDYLRLDGSTSADVRKQLCNTFNNTSNERCRLFLISTRAGGLGINLVGANRVVIFDSSWNPSHDTQSIFRIYRFGQKKPCYIYRFVAQGTMEEKIYSRQVTKMSTALRVVDEHQIKRYFKMEELAQLYEFTPADPDVRETPIVPKDRLLAELLKKQKDWIVSYHEQDSLLENQTSEELSEEERKAAWEDYENEKKGFLVQQHRNSVLSVMGAPMMTSPGQTFSPYDFNNLVTTIKMQNPNMSPMEVCESVLLATKQIQKIHLNHYQQLQAMIYNLKNPMIAPEQRKHLPYGNSPEMVMYLEQRLRAVEENIQRENQVIGYIDQGVLQQSNFLSPSTLMAAGLLRGQPQSSGTNSAASNYVERPSTSVEGSSQKEKNTASNDVILLE